MKANELLRQIRESSGFKTSKSAAEAMGVNVRTYFTHESGERGFDAWIPRYAEFFKVPESAFRPAHNSNFPLVDIANFNALVALSRGATPESRPLFEHEGTFAATMPDVSMRPDIEQGRTLIFTPAFEAPEHSTVLAVSSDMQGGLIRRLRYNGRGGLVLCALNPNFPIITGNVRILARAIGRIETI